MSLMTTSGKRKVNLALKPTTYEYLRGNSMGERSMGELVDRLCEEAPRREQEAKLAEKVDALLKRLDGAA